MFGEVVLQRGGALGGAAEGAPAGLTPCGPAGLTGSQHETRAGFSDLETRPGRESVLLSERARNHDLAL